MARDGADARTDVIGLDSAILQHPRTWEASGHLQNFTDPLVDCKNCKQRFRADHIEGDRCPACGGELTEARQFNLMFKTFMGPVEDTANTVYLRPETAQGIFANFANVIDTQRVKLPFGIAQTGKSFRNEITPGNFIFRTREFEQMEMEFFVKPDPAEEQRWFDYWVDERFNWYVSYGIASDHLRLRPHAQDELSHYSRGTTDIEYLYPFGWGELEGIARRGSFDLDQHAQVQRQGSDLLRRRGEGALSPVGDRAGGGRRPRDARVSCSTPTMKMWSRTKSASCCGSTRAWRRSKSRSIRCCARADSRKRRTRCANCSQRYFTVAYDQAGSIGRRYRRQDEIGTPFGVTIDHQTMEDDTVTLRDRDTTQQERVPIGTLVATLIERIGWYREA